MKVSEHPTGVLLERERELATIDIVLEDLACVVGIEGSAGLGKSRLLEVARARAEGSGVQVLCARGALLEREFAYGVVRQLFEPPLHTVAPEERDLLFAGAAGAARALLFPEDHAAGGDASFATLHGLYWLLVNLAESAPVALCVDDLQWADEPSLRFLAFVQGRLEGLPLLVLVASRPLEELDPAPAVLATLLSAPGVERLRLHALSQRAVGVVVRDHVGDHASRAFIRSCHVTTAGNPFYLGLLLDSLAAEDIAPDSAGADHVRRIGPHAVSRAVLARLASLPRACTEMARAIAVLGDGARLELAAALSGVDPEAARDAADRLVRESILRRTETLDFAHPIVHQAVYADLGPASLDQRHLTTARLLRESGAPPERVATQLLHTNQSAGQWAVDALRAAAAAAAGVGASDVAANYLRRALREEVDSELRAQLLLELGTAEAARQEPTCVGHLQEAMAATASLERRAAAAQVLARVFVLTGEVDAARDLLEAIADEAWPVDPAIAKVADASLLLANSIATPSRNLSWRAARLRREVSPPVSPEDTAALATLSWQAALENRPVAEVAELAQRGWADGRLLREQTTEAPMVGSVLAALTCVDAVAEARAGLDAAIDDSTARGLLAIFATLSVLRAQLLLRCGELARAESDADVALRAAREAHALLLVPAVVACLVAVMVEREQIEAAATLLTEEGLTGEDVRDFGPASSLRHSRGRLLLAQGDAPSAAAELLACAREQEARGARGPLTLQWAPDAVLALHQAGQHAEAARLAAREVELARACGSARAIGAALHTLGLVAARADRVATLERAVRTLAASPARLEHARALIDYGTALRRDKRRIDAREPLTEALHLAHACGAGALVERASTELTMLGARPRNLLLSGAEALTPSERRVTDMAAAGMTNKQIAQALFVTLKTVESQLTSSYRKLGIRTRRDLAAALAGPPLPP